MFNEQPEQTMKSKLLCHPRELNPPPSARDVEATVMSNQDHLVCLHFICFCYKRKYNIHHVNCFCVMTENTKIMFITRLKIGFVILIILSWAR